MRTVILFFAVFLGISSVGVNHAKAENTPYLSGSINAGVVGALQLENELAFDAVLILNVPLPNHFLLFLEGGIGGAFFGADGVYTLPLGGGLMYMFSDDWKFGLAFSYTSRIGHFEEGSFIAAPILQRTLVRHSGPFGEISGFLAAGMAGQVHPGHPFSLGLAATAGIEFELEAQ